MIADTAFEPVIGLEVHAELATRSKMFCACPVVDSTLASPNSAVCPVCSGMPGVLPVVNRQAVEYGLRVALALGSTVAPTSLFARKNYFYPDLPKGYQISQYEYPLAQNGRLVIQTAQGECTVRIRRVHLEEDTGKLTHLSPNGPPIEASTGTPIEAPTGAPYSLVDLNRAGVPLLEIVSEPDLHSVEEVRAYAVGLRALLRYLGVNSGDMQKGVMRFEANVSVRPRGSDRLGTRVEIKNLNSFRALERSIAYEVQRQSERIRQGLAVRQETVGWDEALGATFSQRSKEEAHDYRYFPEPDLPPLVIEPEWIEQVQASLPELPQAKIRRFQDQYRLPAYDAGVLVMEPAVADYFEAVAAASPTVSPKLAANWISGELFGLMNQSGDSIDALRIAPSALAALLEQLERGEINPLTAKAVLAEMYASGQTSQAIISTRGLGQISDVEKIAGLVRQALRDHPHEVSSYLAGKETLAHWFFGQVMRQTQGQANPQVVRQELERQLGELRVNS